MYEIIFIPVLLYFYFQLIYFYNYYCYFKGIPGLWPNFPFGDLYNKESFSKSTFARDLQKIAEKNGNPHVFLFNTGPKPWIMINSPEALKELLLTKSDSFKKGAMFDGIRKFVGKTLLVLEEQEWKAHKNIIFPLFRTGNIEVYNLFDQYLIVFLESLFISIHT